MSNTYDMVCHDCKETLWFGQSSVIYGGEGKSCFLNFLLKHRYHNLTIIDNYHEDGFEEYTHLLIEDDVICDHDDSAVGKHKPIEKYYKDSMMTYTKLDGAILVHIGFHSYDNDKKFLLINCSEDIYNQLSEIRIDNKSITSYITAVYITDSSDKNMGGLDMLLENRKHALGKLYTKNIDIYSSDMSVVNKILDSNYKYKDYKDPIKLPSKDAHFHLVGLGRNARSTICFYGYALEMKFITNDILGRNICGVAIIRKRNGPTRPLFYITDTKRPDRVEKSICKCLEVNSLKEYGHYNKLDKIVLIHEYADNDRGNPLSHKCSKEFINLVDDYGRHSDESRWISV